MAHLSSVLPLLGAQMNSEVRPRLYLATARLATQAGWMSFLGNQHDAARRLWMIGLEVARAAEYPQGSDLTVYLLFDMAIQAVGLGRPDEALRLVYLGYAAAVGAHPVSASTMCCLASIQAQAHAAQRDAAGCERTLGQAMEHFSSIDSATRPPWGAFVDDAVLSGEQGAAYYELAVAGRGPRVAARAVSLLRDAVDSLGPDYARIRATKLVDLTGAHALAGDTDTAVTIGPPSHRRGHRAALPPDLRSAACPEHRAGALAHQVQASPSCAVASPPRDRRRVTVGKHEDKNKEEEKKWRDNGQVSPGTVVSPKDPRGKHSTPEPGEPEKDQEE